MYYPSDRGNDFHIMSFSVIPLKLIKESIAGYRNNTENSKNDTNLSRMM